MPTLWPHVPSFASESLQFSTDVQQAYTGEMRYSLHEAVQALSYGFGYTPDQASRAAWLLRSDPDAEWYVPLWHDGTRVASTISSGASSLTVDTNAEYVAGGFAAIIKDDQTAEVVTINAVGSGTITLTGTVSATYTASALSPVTVAPVRTCIAPAGLQKATQYGLSRQTVVFLAKEGSDIASNPFSQLSGFDVLTDIPRIGEPYGGGTAQEMDLFGSGTGLYTLTQSEGYARHRTTLAFLDQTSADRYRRRQWLHSVRGKDRAFWAPSWLPDMILTASIGTSDTDITVEEFAADDTQLVGRAVYIREGASAVSRVITAASTAAGVHTLTIAATGVAFTTAATVSALTLSRFDTDIFDIDHRQTPDGFLSRFSAPLIEVAA